MRLRLKGALGVCESYSPLRTLRLGQHLARNGISSSIAAVVSRFTRAGSFRSANWNSRRLRLRRPWTWPFDAPSQRSGSTALCALLQGPDQAASGNLCGSSPVLDRAAICRSTSQRGYRDSVDWQSNPSFLHGGEMRMESRLMAHESVLRPVAPVGVHGERDAKARQALPATRAYLSSVICVTLRLISGFGSLLPTARRRACH